MKHFFYAGGWKKFEQLWNMLIQLKRLNLMTPLLEAVLSKVSSVNSVKDPHVVGENLIASSNQGHRAHGA